jgi:hypothetical protein
MQSSLAQLEHVFLGYDKYPIIGKSGMVYHFNTHAYPFEAPHDPAIFYLVRMTEQAVGKWACVVLYRGLASDLQQELARHQMALFEGDQLPNAILWLPVGNGLARLATWYDLGGLQIGIGLTWGAAERKPHTVESSRSAIFQQ